MVGWLVVKMSAWLSAWTVCLAVCLDGQARGQAVCLVGWLVRSEAISLDGEAAREAVSCGSLW